MGGEFMAERDGEMEMTGSLFAAIAAIVLRHLPG
jgi:hypothetical protein